MLDDLWQHVSSPPHIASQCTPLLAREGDTDALSCPEVHHLADLCPPECHAVIVSYHAALLAGVAAQGSEQHDVKKWSVSLQK